MSKKIALLALAHGRSGDKGDAVNIGVIARRPEWYEFLRSELDSYKVAHFLRGMATGPVMRYELPNLHALNFIVNGALAGGGSVGLKIDAQGKTYAHAMLRYPVEVPPTLFAEIEKHWEGAIPNECFYHAELHRARGEESVIAERDNRVLTLTLNRPKARNSLTVELLHDLAREVRNASETPGSRDKVIVIRGSGASFCAGMDLKVLRALPATYPSYMQVAEALHDVLHALITSPLPVITAIHGDAMGGGAALALACDICVATPDAQFAMPETRIGFIPGMVSALAMRRISPAAARELLITGRRISGRDGFNHGFVHHLADTPDAHAAKIANALVAENSADAMARSKALLMQTTDAALLNELRTAIHLFAGGATRASFQSGMEAFTAKKAPDWSHDSRE